LLWCNNNTNYFAEELYKYVVANFDIDVEIFDSSKNNNESIDKLQLNWKNLGYKTLWLYSPIFDDNSMLISPPINYSIVCVPTSHWARKLFGDKVIAEDCLDFMWERYLTICRVDTQNFIEKYHQHVKNLLHKSNILNNLRLHYLDFCSTNGTKIRVELHYDSKWISCCGVDDNNNYFIKCLPTEEVFVSPLKHGTQGIVYSTQDIVVYDFVVQDCWLRFDKGKVVDFGAKTNKDKLAKLLDIDNARFLGEVAIVPHNNPISCLGILWQDTSIDENASCHFAIGQSYRDTISDGLKMSKEQLINLGLNQSQIHLDFLIGSADMCIIGTDFLDNTIEILNNGEWCL